jgi:transposase InsO family protein
MATKGQKFKNYSKEIKEEILKRYFEEYIPTTALSEEYGVSKKTIQNWIYRKIVAHQISKRNDIKLVIDTLNQAIAKTKDVSKLVIHSDQGFQYTSFEYKAVCESNGIQISMSRKGTPIDDSPIESFHSILKKETLYNNYITSFEEYLLLVEDWLIFYNSTRLKNRKR